MSEQQFPSGPWVGFYNYTPRDRHRMDLHLEFAAGRISGDGNDDVGRFLIRGSYDTADGECYWTKTYPGAHDVFYRGFREGKGIWGTWEIGILAHGGFHIWPKGEQDAETQVDSAETAAPVDAITQEDTAAVPQRRMLGRDSPNNRNDGPPTVSERALISVRPMDSSSAQKGTGPYRRKRAAAFPN